MLIHEVARYSHVLAIEVVDTEGYLRAVKEKAEWKRRRVEGCMQMRNTREAAHRRPTISQGQSTHVAALIVSGQKVEMTSAGARKV